MDGLGYVSIPAVKQYLRYAATLDVDIPALLAVSKIPEVALEEENERISGEQLQLFLDALIQQVDDPILGLKSGEFVQPGSYSVLGYITMTCATLAEAIERIQPYEKLVGDMGVTSMTRQEQQVHLNWHCAYALATVRAHMVDNVLASWVAYARWLAGSDIGPARVHLQRVKPDDESVQYYQTLFACPVLFGQACNSLIIPVEHLSIALRQPDHILRQTLEQHALAQMSALAEPQTMSVRVKDIIRILLAKGITRKDMVAAHLGVSERTLQRKLQLESTSYQKLLDEARLVLAQEYLSNTQLSFDDIAIHLGFSEIRSFFRSFKLWTGQTPSEYRAPESHKCT